MRENCPSRSLEAVLGNHDSYSDYQMAANGMVGCSETDGVFMN
jgi:hypothetical protein